MQAAKLCMILWCSLKPKASHHYAIMLFILHTNDSVILLIKPFVRGTLLPLSHYPWSLDTSIHEILLWSHHTTSCPKKPRFHEVIELRLCQFRGPLFAVDLPKQALHRCPVTISNINQVSLQHITVPIISEGWHLLHFAVQASLVQPMKGWIETAERNMWRPPQPSGKNRITDQWQHVGGEHLS